MLDLHTVLYISVRACMCAPVEAVLWLAFDF